MDLRALQSKRLLTASTFLAATFVLALQFISPSTVVVSVGENGATTTELGGYFTYRGAALIALSGCIAGASGAYLVANDGPSADVGDGAATSDAVTAAGSVPTTDGGSNGTPSEDLLEKRREEWEDVVDRLADNEREVYETVLEADGVLPQSDIVDRTEFSKATVSRALDSLETKNLVERKRRGMGNTVLLR